MCQKRLPVLIEVILLFCFLPLAVGAETAELFSPSTANALREKAADLYADPNAAAADGRQAMVFLDAVGGLDRKAEHTLGDIVRLAWRFPSVDAHDQAQRLFYEYAANDAADLEVLRLCVQYLVEPMNTREEREQFFIGIVRSIGTRHKILASDLSTQLGLLAAERADMQAAEFYLMQAYNANPYNGLAFDKIMEMTPKQIDPTAYIQHLLLMVQANPYDMDAAYAFANSVYNVGLYELAAGAYEYCADLFAILHGGEPLPSAIYLPWAISNYNQPQNRKQCLSIAKSVLKNGDFNLYLEAIAGNAAIGLGNADEGADILDTAAQKAVKSLADAKISNNDLAWFYCFARPDPEKALEWANKANATEPNSPRTAAILAYALVMNGKQEIAGSLIEQNYKEDQIAALAMGQIQLAKDPNADPNSGLAIIKSAIALDAGSLEAQRGRELLAQKGSTYVPIYETAVILKNLQSYFGDNIVGKFVTADKFIAVKLVASGNEFSYGSPFNASLAISNNGKEPLVISDGCILNGNIRVDAVVKGDLNEQIHELIVQKIRPSEPIESGRSLFVPIELIQGRLKRLLLEHPQARVEIEFTAWLDPVTDANGAVHNKIAAIKPVRLAVRRNAADVSGSYLQSRLASLTKGQHGQKTKSAQLFAGLLLEQRAAAGSKHYKMANVDSRLIRSGLARCLTDESWNLRVETMLMLADLPLDYNLLNAVSENLDSRQPWPVRMAALWLLGKNNDPAFRRVLDWTAQNDDDTFVLEMASALGAAVPQERLARTAAAEPNKPLRMAARETYPPANSPFAAEAPAQKPEPNKPEKTVPAEPNQQEVEIFAEPNQPAESAPPEANQPQEKAAEPNDIIEDILKS